MVLYCAGNATNTLSKCLFDFSASDMRAEITRLRQQDEKDKKYVYRGKSDEQVINSRKLSQWGNAVRRIYLDAATQIARLKDWAMHWGSQAGEHG
jgi:hypothetical protein